MRLTTTSAVGVEELDSMMTSATRVLKGGGIVCFPTDTVYGLAVSAEQPQAVKRLYQAKQREHDKPLVLFPPAHTDLVHFTKRLPAIAVKLIGRFWPGPLTIVLPSAIEQPLCLVGTTGGLGTRIPDHPVAQALAKNHGLFLATTSANLSGHPPVTQAGELPRQLKAQIDMIIDTGQTPSGTISTVVEIHGKNLRVLRSGAVDESDISAAAREPLSILFVCTANLCRSIIAELMLTQIIEARNESCRVESAGTCVFRPTTPSQVVHTTLKQQGITTMPPMAKPVTASLVRSSDLILVMEMRHKKQILDRFPQAQHKVWLLREFTRGKQEDIVDPISFSHSSYTQAVADLEKEVSTLTECIFG